MFESIHDAIQKVLRELNISDIEFSLEHPKDLAHGDYMTNVALIVGKKVGKNPIDVAQEIVIELHKQNIEQVEAISIASPGFINFVLKREVFIQSLTDAQSPQWGSTSVYAGKTILVEHSSPNLFKPFHIGHLMNNTIGESLFRLAHFSGAHAIAISFPSDISLGIAKAIFIILEQLNKDESYAWDDIVTMGKSYMEGVKRYEEDVSIHERVKEIANNLYVGDESKQEVRLYLQAKHINMSYFEQVVKQLGSTFENYIYESEAGIVGKKLVLDNIPQVFSESEGAVVYIPDENKNLHTAVFINSQGNPTYEAKDLGLLKLKFMSYSPDISIIVTDKQQESHFYLVVDAAGKIEKKWEQNSVHRSHGRMTFKGNKMSSRLGGVPLVEDIIDAITQEASEKNIVPENLNVNVSEKLKEGIRNIKSNKSKAKNIAIAALKFSILRAAAGKNVDFDPDTSLSFTGDSGPYLQYTAVRAGSLLQKGIDQNIVLHTTHAVSGTEILERLMARFPEIVARSQIEWAPHYIVTYLSLLAQEFNSWYAQGKIIDEDTEATGYRLSIVSAARQTLVRGLWMLGIEVPEKM